MPFEIPESYRTYRNDTAVRTAVDHLLDSADNNKLNLPADIEWKDLPGFHRAVLAAHQVRSDYSIFLIDLWNAIWPPTLRKSGFHWAASRPANPTESSVELDTHSVWKNKYLWCYFDVTDGQFGFEGLESGVVMIDDRYVQLGIGIWAEDGLELSVAATKFGESWKMPYENEKGWYYTRDDLGCIQDDGTIDLAPLHQAATSFLAAVGSLVQG